MCHNRILSVLSWYVGRFNLVTGIVALSIASAILAVSNTGRTTARNSEITMRVGPMILAALSFLLFGGRPERTSRDPSGRF